jgi:hypothetical protein
MQTQFSIRLERVEDCEMERRRLYVIVTERDGNGHQEGDVWIPIEQLPNLIRDLQTFIAKQVEQAA